MAMHIVFQSFCVDILSFRIEAGNLISFRG